MQNIVTMQDKGIDEAKPQKPYFENNNILIYKDDVLKITSIPENSVDLIITSLAPYYLN